MFDFELPANQAVSDYYTLATGGAGTPDSALPTAKGIADSAANAITDPERPGVVPDSEPPFAQPTKDLNKQPTQERDAVASDAETPISSERSRLFLMLKRTHKSEPHISKFLRRNLKAPLITRKKN